MKRKPLLILSGALCALALASCGNDDATTTNTNTPSGNPTASIPQDTSKNTTTTTKKLDKDKTPTIFLAGDSTVQTYQDNQFIGGWGQYFNYFLDDKIEVRNCAIGGRSSRSFINEGRLYDIEGCTSKKAQNNGNSIEHDIKAGDFVFVQFGHNDDDTKDGSTKDERMVPLGTPDAKGIYPVTAGTRVATPSTLSSLGYGSTCYVYGNGTYKWYLKQYIDFARSKGATPVLVTPVARVKFDADNKIVGGPGLHGDNFAYVQAVKQLAEEEDCLLVDLFTESKNMLEAVTSTNSDGLMALKPNSLTGEWPADFSAAYKNLEAGYTGMEATHYNKYGAYLLAGKVAEAVLGSEDVKKNDEYYNFADHVLTTPNKYINPASIMNKRAITKLEGLFKTVNVTDPNRAWPDPAKLVTKINSALDGVTVTAENYKSLKDTISALKVDYAAISVDDKAKVTNYDKITTVEKAVLDMEEALRPKPTKTDVYSFESMSTGSITTTQVITEGFTAVGATGKAVEVKSLATQIKYNGTSYSFTQALSMGGAMADTYRYLEVKTTSKATITVIAKSSGSDSRVVNVKDSAGNTVGTTPAPANADKGSVEVSSAGTYKIGSAGSGMYIIAVIVEYFD